jgi:beta-mannosidase
MDCEDWRSFPASKFISEFGWQSPPTFDSFAAASSQSLGDWAFPDLPKTNDTVLEFRQRHQNGLNEILAQIKRHYRVPERWLVRGDEEASLQLFRDWFWLSGHQQAACYRTGVGAWRRFRSEPNSLTMGVLYWQLNDIWAGYSWSGYDVSGVWKPLSYIIQKQFAPLVVQVVTDSKTGSLDVFYVSDEVADVSDAKLKVAVRRVLGPAAADEKKNNNGTECAADADAVAAQWTTTVAINGSSSGRLWSKPIDDLLRSAPGCSRSNCYVTAELEASYPEVGVALPNGTIPLNAARDRTLTADGEAWLAYWKDAQPAPAAGLRASGFAQESDRQVSFTVRAEGGATAPLVTLESPIPGHFSDSGFTLHAGSAGCDGRKIVFTADAPITARELRDGLRLSSLAHHQSWDRLFASGGKAAAEEMKVARPSL